MYSIVIAKYKEDISWINNIDKNNIKIYVYDKDKNTSNIYDKNELYNNIIYTKLINYGRESHTYLTYIIDNYDNLSDYTIFTQGKYQDHFNDNIIKLFNYPNKFNKGVFQYYFRLRYHYTELELNEENLYFGDWLIKYVDENFKYYYDANEFFVNYGAIFCICKENILSRSKEYYINLLKQLQSYNPEVGHFFERSWYYIFNIHKINNIITYDYNYINTKYILEKNKEIYIYFKTLSDATIGLFNNDNIYYEIVIGGWNNTKSVIRNTKQGNNIREYEHNYCNKDDYKYIIIFYDNNNIIVKDDNNNILLFDFLNINLDYYNIMLSSWYNHFCLWNIKY